MVSPWKYVVYSLRIRRVEYRIAELPIYLIPVLLASPSADFWQGLVFWEGLLVFLFLFALGDLLNCLADRDLDEVYKPHLTEAVDGIGIRGVIIQSAVSALAAIGIAIHLASSLDRWLLLPSVIVGCFLAYAYSVEPIRLKRRGWWQLAFYWLGLFTGPMIFALLLYVQLPSLTLLLVCVAFGMMQTGIILINTAEDYPEDMAMGVRTIIVTLGMLTGVRLAIAFTLLGALILLGTFAAIILEREMPAISFVALLPAGLTALLNGWQLSGLFTRIRGATEAQVLEEVRSSAKWVPFWISSQAVSGCLTALVIGLYSWAATTN